MKFLYIDDTSAPGFWMITFKGEQSFFFVLVFPVPNHIILLIFSNVCFHSISLRAWLSLRALINVNITYSQIETPFFFKPPNMGLFFLIYRISVCLLNLRLNLSLMKTVKFCKKYWATIIWNNRSWKWKNIKYNWIQNKLFS